MHRCGCFRAYTGRVVSEPLMPSSFEAPVERECQPGAGQTRFAWPESPLEKVTELNI